LNNLFAERYAGICFSGNHVRGHIGAIFILFNGHIQPGVLVEPEFLGNIITRKLELVFPDVLERDLVSTKSLNRQAKQKKPYTCAQ
jgi:hypothetical protein